ncbi:MarR family winged helix-turn-helix transcriptional regulator [Mycolicibacterium fortuitum]|jgi:DNA-binding MarR family transcriptional regulator|uniref:Transcriptional regulator n=1 Tax=Mycolicibacterium fortuitum subsp. fortuitum DSM 46621 = ATCC 6841 = JCM 6387 TaxID=1214102 RepID=K0V9Y4_MYCFO|nr:MarR family transcriptional regulator [Mycolicibacterium fortuitum]CRL79065.1 transcriptional regulator [Mycolicibacter nonchromogenicus]EJZ15877.1 transcriptional regulator [Mycolicibacterium fortuitum subsp. fortuitum DSM 46621 = ATCC 6841 = JCM 6387]MBP3085072.1 MarR family transcriptional regulator [Mycolicibacterium fortuitum]MCA4721792.1 MarR family transcriptional regulator [Mycolicibacterium fortuitum]OBG53225.1 MarR family transcriptional regulator [Mycolicibacterium fortuitum]
MVKADTLKTEHREPEDAEDYAVRLERATRGLLAVNVMALEPFEKRIGLSSLRALQSLGRIGPCLVSELAQDLQVAVSTASRLADRLAEAGLISRGVSPQNRRATRLALTEDGRAILDDLVAHRVALFREVTASVGGSERSALLRGAAAFTAAYRAVADIDEADVANRV